jgi:endonuclease/exonuclease/phosphatase family metal-dependent hydrolase
MRRYEPETTRECVWIEISVSDNFSLLIVNPYFPPDCNVTIIDNCLNFLEQNLKTHQYPVIMLGDFNVPNYDRINGAPIPNSCTIKSKEIQFTPHVLSRSSSTL